MISRRLFLLSSVFPVLGYARFVEPHLLRVREREIRVDELSSALDGVRIAHLTDFHYHPSMASLVERAVARVMQWQPDLIALTGDFVDHAYNHLPELLAKLAPLQAPRGVYATLGNHDYSQGEAAFFRRAFDSTNVRLLVNEVHMEQRVELIGLDSIYSGTPRFDLPYSSSSRDHLRIVLSHEPDTFDRVLESYDPHLQLSGHTHGGQCRIPLIGYAPFTPPYGRRYKDGEFSQQGGHLFVSSGLGTSTVRLRFACCPEVALLTLRSA